MDGGEGDGGRGEGNGLGRERGEGVWGWGVVGSWAGCGRAVGVLDGLEEGGRSELERLGGNARACVKVWESGLCSGLDWTGVYVGWRSVGWVDGVVELVGWLGGMLPHADTAACWYQWMKSGNEKRRRCFVVHGLSKERGGGHYFPSNAEFARLFFFLSRLRGIPICLLTQHPLPAPNLIQTPHPRPHNNQDPTANSQTTPHPPTTAPP